MPNIVQSRKRVKFSSALSTTSSRLELLDFIDKKIDATEALLAELSLHRMRLIHGLVPTTHIALLLGAEAGGRACH
jgi:hypothetical protein